MAPQSIKLPVLEIWVFNSFFSHIQSVARSHPFAFLSLSQICAQLFIFTATDFVQDSFLALTIIIAS